jgi:hypothetical protein
MEYEKRVEMGQKDQSMPKPPAPLPLLSLHLLGVREDQKQLKHTCFATTRMDPRD